MKESELMENAPQAPQLLAEEKNPLWLTMPGIVRTYLAATLPLNETASSAYAFVFKDGTLLQTEQREGERPQRQLDIPGGHIDPGETLEQTVVRETFEETGVHVRVTRLVAYKEIELFGEKPVGYPYSFPKSYLPYFLCEIVEETPFNGNDDAHGRKWVPLAAMNESNWCMRNRALIEAVVKLGNVRKSD